MDSTPSKNVPRISKYVLFFIQKVFRKYLVLNAVKALDILCCFIVLFFYFAFNFDFYANKWIKKEKKEKNVSIWKRIEI